jgi:hypothetical protein
MGSVEPSPMNPFLGPVIYIACGATCLEHWNLVIWQRKVMLLVPGTSVNRLAERLQLTFLRWCRHLITSVPPQNLGFIFRPVSVGHDVTDKAALKQVFFFCVYFNLPLSFSFHQCPIISFLSSTTV